MKRQAVKHPAGVTLTFTDTEIAMIDEALGLLWHLEATFTLRTGETATDMDFLRLSDRIEAAQ